MEGRFEFVEFSEASVELMLKCKDAALKMEEAIGLLDQSRSKSLALTKLEECYMWIGKAIRDQQCGVRQL